MKCSLNGMKRCQGRVKVTVNARVFGVKGKKGRADRVVANGKFGVKAGKKRFVRVKLNGKARRKLKRSGRLRGRIVFNVAQAGASPKKVAKTVRLDRRR